MSAYLCNDLTFAALGYFAVGRHRGDSGAAHWPSYIPGFGDAAKALTGKPWEQSDDDERAYAIATILKVQNVRSVNYRYKEADHAAPVNMNGKAQVIAEHDGKRKAYTYSVASLRLRPVAVMKICACVEYQSCETPDWEQTLAAEILRRIVAMTIRRLPGYDDAPWGLGDEVSMRDVA